MKETSNQLNRFDFFLKILADKQEILQGTDVDIRYKVMSLTSKHAGFSFSEKILTSEYPRNINALFQRALPFDSPKKKLKAASSYYLLGALNNNNTNINQGWDTFLELYSSEIKEKKSLFFMEQGFIASVENWAPQFRKKPESACLGYVYDDIAQYYMAEYPNRLIQKLNSNEELNDRQLTRSKINIDRVVASKVSKYNNQPIVSPSFKGDPRQKILVCDQSFADASTVFGLIDEDGFKKMLECAIKENPDALIIVKTHPDTSWQSGIRSGYYNHLQNTENLFVLRDPINPFSVFELVDKVYVGTSQMGMEALLAGKEVVCFGAPFYAGWGLTDDRIEIPHRKRNRNIEELFFYFYIWYTIYHVPEKEIPSQIEDAIDYINVNRRQYVPKTNSLPPQTAEPDISVIIPVYGVAPYIEETITSIQNQSLTNIEIIPVDDCSQDGSAALLKSMAEHDDRIKPIFLEKNVGQGFARNRGVSEANGKYIWFLDGDDYFPNPKHLENVFLEAEQQGSDMVRGRKLTERVEDFEGNFIRNRLDSIEEYFDENIHATTYASHPALLHNRHFCNFLYRREFLRSNDINFRTPQWEERAFLLKALLSAKSISCINSEAFIYRIRTDSTARRKKTIKDADFLLQNFIETVHILMEFGANESSSPLFEHFTFNVSQFIHYFFRGFFWDIVTNEVDKNSRDEYFLKISNVLNEANFQHSDFNTSPKVLSVEWLSGSVYPFIVACLKSKRFEDLSKAVQNTSYPQLDLYNAFIDNPTDQFASALNDYARNEQVTLNKPSPSFNSSQLNNIRLIIHIGSTKTGSTYLQHWLNANRPELLAQGIYYPEIGMFWQPGRPHKTAGHSKFISSAVKTDYSFLNHIKSLIELSQGKIKTVVLSSEAFFLNPNSLKLTDYFSDFSVELLVYLRRQDDWANSQYCEFVGGGAVGRVSVSIDDWISQHDVKRLLSYRTMLQSWEESLGIDKITVRTFEHNQLIGNSIEADFSDAVGISNYESLKKPKNSQRNSSALNRTYIHLLQIFNGFQFKSQESYFKFISRVNKIYSSYHPSESQPVNVLEPSTREKILRQYEDENQSIALRYLKRSDGVLFEDNEIKPLEAHKDQVSSSEINEVFDAFESARLHTTTPPSEGKTGVINKKTQYNYGRFNWRKKVFVPLLSPLVPKHLSQQEKDTFREEPAAFFREGNNWKRRIIRKICFP